MSHFLKFLFVAFSVLFCSCAGDRRQTYAWVLATASPENTVTGIYANTFAQKVEELSGGELKLQVYHNSVLGGDTELIESCQCGDIPFVVQNTAPEVSYMPRLCLFDLPCVFQDVDELHKVLDDSLFLLKVNQIYEEAGFHLLGMADQHFRVMTCNKEVHDLSDLRGIKIRTMENSYHMAFWKSIGANPTPMAFSELYVGLEQHTVDAQENPYEVICSNGFYEVQKDVIQTNHLPHLLALVTNNDFYHHLSEHDREIVDQAAAYACEYACKQALQRVEGRMAEIEKGGATIIPVSGELHQAMKKASEPLYQQIRKVVADDDLFRLYLGE